MKKRAGLVLCLLVVIIISICFGFTAGFTAGVSENKNEFFSAFARKVAPVADSELFVRLFGKEDDSEEEKLKTLFKEVWLPVGENFKNASFYSADPNLDLKSMKLTAVSSDENVASASLLGGDEFSVNVSIFAKAFGKAEVFLLDESGKTVSEKICVSVGSAAASGETAENETAVPLQGEAEVETTETEVGETEKKTTAPQKETTEKLKAETTKKEASALSEEVTENKREKEKHTQTSAKQTEKEAKKETKGQTESVKTEGNGNIVYRTPSGSCYHRIGCRYVKSNATALTVGEAKSSGLRACKVCKP